jgi:hypothetical protein
MAQGIACLVQHLILLQGDPVQMRLQCREVVRLQSRQEAIGAVIDLGSWSGGVVMRFHSSS